MKKTKLLLLLSLPMVLASCGKKNNSSTPTPASSSDAGDSSLISEDISSSGVTSENQMTPEEKDALFLKGYNEICKLMDGCKKNEMSVTYVETETDHQFEGMYSYNDHSSTEPYEEQYQEYYGAEWTTVSYDSVNKVGYELEEETDGGIRTFDEIEWVAKDGSDYKLYDSDYETVNDVDDGYAWNQFALNSRAFEMFDDMSAEEMLLNLDYGERMIQTQFKNAQSAMIPGNVGTIDLKQNFDIEYTNNGNKGEFNFVISLAADYKKPETFADLNEVHLTDFKATLVEEAKIKFDEKGVYDINLSEAMYMLIEGTMKEARLVSEQGFEYADTVTRDLKYTPYTNADLDFEHYADNGEIIGDLDFYDEYGFYCGYCSNYDLVEQRYVIHPSECISSDAYALGVTVEYYLDPEFKNKVNPDTIEKRSYDRNIYIKRIIPNDVAYVDVKLDGILLDDIVEGSNIPGITSWDSYVGAPKNNYVPSAYEETYFYSNTTDKFYTSATFAPTKATIIGTTDATATIKNQKFIDLKGGNYYVIEYTCEQVA
ncbi:MAG: hypothetical protein MJ238_02285 [Bacilli bacterium]|nr:hypothetical protein [Bacilli bacterium]